jgi:hypothetical protein
MRGLAATGFATAPIAVIVASLIVTVIIAAGAADLIDVVNQCQWW